MFIRLENIGFCDCRVNYILELSLKLANWRGSILQWNFTIFLVYMLCSIRKTVLKFGVMFKTQSISVLCSDLMRWHQNYMDLFPQRTRIEFSFEKILQYFFSHVWTSAEIINKLKSNVILKELSRFGCVVVGAERKTKCLGAVNCFRITRNGCGVEGSMERGRWLKVDIVH